MSNSMSVSHSEEAFSFNVENIKKIQQVIARYPAGRQASAVLPLLDLAQRQNGGWLSRAAIEAVAQVLNMAPMRVYEVATFYTMFNFKPVGEHFVQVCTTTPCWLRGSDEILKVCKRHLGVQPGEVSADGKFSYREVECLGACANAPMVQINDDYYEDLDSESFQGILEKLASGEKVPAGSAVGRRASAPFQGDS